MVSKSNPVVRSIVCQKGGHSREVFECEQTWRWPMDDHVPWDTQQELWCVQKSEWAPQEITRREMQGTNDKDGFICLASLEFDRMPGRIHWTDHMKGFRGSCCYSGSLVGLRLSHSPLLSISTLPADLSSIHCTAAPLQPLQLRYSSSPKSIKWLSPCTNSPTAPEAHLAQPMPSSMPYKILYLYDTNLAMACWIYHPFLFCCNSEHAVPSVPSVSSPDEHFCIFTGSRHGSPSWLHFPSSSSYSKVLGLLDYGYCKPCIPTRLWVSPFSLRTSFY